MSNWQNRIVKYDNLDPKKVKYNENNYREHPELQRKLIDGVLDDIGWVAPIVINTTTGNLVDGQMRVEEAIANGEKEIPVVYVNLTKEEENKILATFDPITSFAKEDKGRLQKLLETLNNKNDRVSDLVSRVAKRNRLEFTPEGVEDNHKQKREEKRLLEEEELNEVKDKWGVEDGQVWNITSRNGGVHKLVCGSSDDEAIVHELIDGTKSVLMVTDPPYGIDFSKTKCNPVAKEWAGIKGDTVSGDDLRVWLGYVLNIWIKKMDPRSSFYIWTAAMEESFAMFHAMKNAGIHIQSQIVWAKNRPSMGQSDYQWMHENCWYGYLEGQRHIWNGGRNQFSVWSIDKINLSEYLHPMQKPVELYSIPMKNHTDAGDICLDPFSGSGTQIIAAEQYGRICYAMENDPTWVAVSLQRFSDAGLKPELE
jgi:hypothetical protein